MLRRLGFLFNPLMQDMLIVKPQKRSPLVSKMIVLLLIMICGVYICSVCLKQEGININPSLVKILQVEKPRSDPNISISEIPLVHYPEPTTYKR